MKIFCFIIYLYCILCCYLLTFARFPLYNSNYIRIVFIFDTIKDVAYVLRAEKKNIVARFEHERSKSERKLAKRKEGESGNSGRPEKQRASVVAGGGALRTLDWDTSAINLSV